MTIDKVYPGGSLWERLCLARTKHDIDRVAGECTGAIYWHNIHSKLRDQGHKVESFEHCGIIDDDELARYRYLMGVCLYRLANGMAEHEVNERGNIVERSFIQNGDRYQFDFSECSSENGWRQFDTKQDAWYFGVWVQMERREIVTYCEGDVIRVACPTADSFRAELEDAERFYGSPPPAFVTCDGVTSVDGKIVPTGNVTNYYDNRPSAQEVA